VALVLLGATACGADQRSSGADPTPTASPSESSSATSASPTPGESASPAPSSPAPSSPTSSPTASPEDDDEPTATAAPAGTGPTGRPASDLLTAAELPRLDAASPWRAGGTVTVGSDAFGVCQKFDALTLGAREGVERRFTATDATAAHQVLDFPDTQNASRAAQVIASWQRDCQGRLPGEGGRVRPRAAVPVAVGSAWWYLATWEQGGTGKVETFGLALDDTRLTLLRMDHDGQDRNYPDGRDPLQRGLAAAAAKLGG
jgi:hypothetical protein